MRNNSVKTASPDKTKSPKTALDYIKQGFNVIPVKHKSKQPINKDWASLQVTEENVNQYFNGENNIGLRTGDGLVDVDLDDPMAVRLADKMMAFTGAVFGRKSNPNSHRLYWCLDMDTNIDTFSFNGKMIIELRGADHQTVVPPSIHPSGEAIEWVTPGFEPTEPPHGYEGLKAEAGCLAATVLLIDCWPGQGTRNEVAGAVAGVMLKAGRDVDEVAKFLELVAQMAGDDEWSSRGKNARSIAKKIDNKDKKIPGAPKLRKLIGEDQTNTILEWLGITETKKKDGPGLDLILNGGELWHSAEDAPFATVIVDDIRQNYAVESKTFSRWLGLRYFELTGKPLGPDAKSTIINLAAAQAQFIGEMHRAWLRVAESDGKLYLDLMDDKWTAIEIDKDGWRPVINPPVRFRRGGGKALPMPVKGGSIELLRKFLNVSDRDFKLIVGFTVAAFRPDRPFPILAISGEQGTAKTTLLRVIKRLVDPGAAEGRGLSKNEDDLVIAASNNWMLTADNLSHVPAAIADALCRLATGGGISKRGLYTDDEEFAIEAMRPVILNGIGSLSEREDLIDRMVAVTLEPILDEDRKLESEFWAEFEEARPLILGALLDAVSTALSREVELEHLPRLADFALWMEQAAPAFGWGPGEMLDAYNEMREEAFEGAAREDVLSATILDWLEKNRNAGNRDWAAAALHTSLNNFLREEGKQWVMNDRSWPKSARWLADRLRRKAPGLRTAGATVEEKHDPSRNIKVWRLEPPPLPEPAQKTMELKR